MTFRVYGNVTINFEVVDASANEILLDTKNLDIVSVTDTTNGTALTYEYRNVGEEDALGKPLAISLGRDLKNGEKVEIKIKFSTTDKTEAIGWLAPEMTLGKKYGLMYTQCEAILCRSMLPIQDSPSAKITVTAALTVAKPLVALYAGIFKGSKDNGNTVTYYYYQKIQIPSYLIAIAAGALERRRLSPRSSVYAEAEIVDAAKWEFEDTERILRVVTRLLICRLKTI